MKDYKPQKKGLKIATRGMEHILSVPYEVSIRWLFYRLYQEGFYTKKEDYGNQYLPLIIKLRYENFNGWRPDILTDESREIIPRDDEEGQASIDDYRDFDMTEKLISRLEKLYVTFPLDHFYSQDFYVEIVYEAKAMTSQFQYYTNNITLVPCGGEASIPYIFEMAKRLVEMSNKYGKPIIVLVFTDADKWGNQIRNAVKEKLELWCTADFKVINCGLTKEQASLYNLPESIGGTGFQWESLEDKSAGKIITEAVAKYVNQDVIDAVKEEQEMHEEKINDQIKKIVGKIEEPLRRLINEALKK